MSKFAQRVDGTCIWLNLPVLAVVSGGRPCLCIQTLGITRKVLTKVYLRRRQAERVVFFLFIQTIPLANLFWIDETAKNRGSDQEMMAYATRGLRARYAANFDKDVRVNMCACFL